MTPPCWLPPFDVERLELTGAAVPVAEGLSVLGNEPGFSRELVRGVEGAARQLKAQIPWLRVFVEGVVIVGKLEN